MQAEVKDALYAIAKEKTGKNSTLKKSIDAALESISKYNPGDMVFSKYLLKSRIEIPFVQALQELAPKSKGMFVAVSAIHRMVTWNSISSECIAFILDGLEKNVVAHSEMRLRILQMLLPLMQQPTLVCGRNLVHLVQIGLLLIETSRNQAVSTSKVIVCHMFANIFERPETLQGLEREQAVKDCREIIDAILAHEKISKMFKLDILKTCIIDSSGFKCPELTNTLAKVCDTLVMWLSSKSPQILTRVFLVFLEIVKQVMQKEEEIVSLVLLVLRTEIEEALEVLREEFIYRLPYRIVKNALESSKELSNIIFRQDKKIDIEKIIEIKVLHIEKPDSTKIDEEAEYTNSLHFYKIIEVAESLRKNVCSNSQKKEAINVDISRLDKAISGFLEYFSAFIGKLENTSNIKKNTRESDLVRKAFLDVIHTLDISDKKDLSILLISAYNLALQNPEIFYSLAFELTMMHKKSVSVWKEFFLVTGHVVEIYPEIDAWSNVQKQILEFDSDVLAAAVDGAVAAESVLPAKHADLFLILLKRKDNLANEFSLLTYKIFGTFDDNISVSEPASLISSFFGAYFSMKPPEYVHEIVFVHMYALYKKLYEKGDNEELLNKLLVSLSLGIRTGGETLRQSWKDIYKILLLSLDSQILADTIFDITQVITDRLLQYLPEKCIKETIQILCISCIKNKRHNVSFQALNCVRDITGYISTAKISEKIRKDTWNASLCLLCTVAYDSRENVRDSAIVQIFESIHTHKAYRDITWQPLVNVFLKRLLYAAVYLKDKEIYTGEHDNSPMEDKNEDKNEDKECEVDEECPCKGTGACVIDIYTEEASDTSTNSIESTRRILIAVVGLISDNFDEIKKIDGFLSLWFLLGKILVRFAADSETEVVVVQALKVFFPKAAQEMYWRTFFFVILDVCSVIQQKSQLPEMLIEMLKQIRRKIADILNESDAPLFFASITSLLKHNEAVSKERVTFLEYEAISLLEEKNTKCTAAVKVQTLLIWLSLARDASEKFSVFFAVWCMRLLYEELSVGQFDCEVHKKSVETLVSFHREKRMYLQYWEGAKKMLKHIFFLEAQRNMSLQIVWALKEMLGISENIYDEDIDKRKYFPNRNILEILPGDENYSIAIREEEKEMCEHLKFLEEISAFVQKEKLTEIFYLMVEIWHSSLHGSLYMLYINTTKTICKVIAQNRSLSGISEKWLKEIFVTYNKEIRIKRTLYSRFQREAICHILENILDGRIYPGSRDVLLDQIILCAESEDRNISRIALKIIRSCFLEQKK